MLSESKNDSAIIGAGKISMSTLLAVLLIEGMISVSLQVTAIRQLTPNVGTNINITSLVIGLFLSALAFGYWFGGRHSDMQKIPDVLTKNLSLSALWISIGMSTAFAGFLLGGGAYYTISNTTRYIMVAAFLLMFMCPAVFMLAQTVPLLSNYLKANHQGKATGNAMSLSTVGSVLGAVFTSLVFFYFLGVSYTLLLSTIMLCGLAILIKPNRSTLSATAIIIGISITTNVILKPDSIIRENAYSTYEVIDSEYLSSPVTIFEVNNQPASLINKFSGDPAPYIKRAKNLLLDPNLDKDLDVLVLGAGGFTLSYASPRNHKFTYVDIDPEIKGIAETHFLKRPVDDIFIAQDARQFLMSKKDVEYDVIFNDLYTNTSDIPWHVATIEYLQVLKSRLSSNGIAAFNMILRDDFSNDTSRRLYKTITTVFPFCYIDPEYVGQEHERANVLFICPNIGHDEMKNTEIYKDDKSFNIQL